MAVTLKTLLIVAPFEKEDRDALLSSYDELDDDQILSLSITAWTALSQMYHARVEFETKKILLEIQEGKRKYNVNDFTEVEAKLIHEYAQKLQSAETEEQIDEVRKQLVQFKTQPLGQDKVSSPPVQKP